LNAIVLLFSRNYHCIRLKIDNWNCKSASGNTNPATGTGIDAISAPTATSKKPAAQNDDADDNNNDNARALSILESSCDDLSVADFHSPPDEFMRYLQVLKSYDESLVHATTCACLEEEEQRRVLEGHA